MHWEVMEEDFHVLVRELTAPNCWKVPKEKVLPIMWEVISGIKEITWVIGVLACKEKKMSTHGLA
jgi:hypothetical protein